MMAEISIRSLMAGIVIAAIGLTAVRTCSPAWAGAMLSVTFFTMTSSLLGVTFRRDRRRVYWIGFATLGWTYLLLWFVPYLHNIVGQFLLCPNFLSYIEQLLHAEPAPPGGMQSVPVNILGLAATGGGFGAHPPTSTQCLASGWGRR